MLNAHCANVVLGTIDIVGRRKLSARNKDQKLVGRFLKIGYFYRLLIYCSIENVQEIWPTKMDFGRPNAEIDRKMAKGQLLFLALEATLCIVKCLKENRELAFQTRKSIFNNNFKN